MNDAVWMDDSLTLCMNDAVCMNDSLTLYA